MDHREVVNKLMVDTYCSKQDCIDAYNYAMQCVYEIGIAYLKAKYHIIPHVKIPSGEHIGMCFTFPNAK